MTTATPLKGTGIRAAMVYALLVLIMNPIFGPVGVGIEKLLSPISYPVAAMFSFHGYPLQGEFFLRILLGLAIGAIWWAIESNRLDDQTMFRALLVELRYVLAAGLIWYGLAHLLAVISPWPSQADWIRPPREMDAPHYMVVWVGSSWLHKISLGLTHLVAGLCLLNRRTALFGAFFGVGVIGNEAITAFSFGDMKSGDYWVYAELSAMATVLVLVDMRRVMDAFSSFTKPLPPPPPPPAWPDGTWPARMAAHARPIALAAIALVNIPTLLKAFDEFNRSPIAGVYKVESYSLNGKDSLNDEDAAARWYLVAIDQCSRFAARVVDGRQFEGAVSVPGAGTYTRRRACEKATSGDTGMLTLLRPDSLPPATAGALEGTVQYTRTAKGLDLTAKVDGRDIIARMRRIPDSAFTQFAILGDAW